MIYKIIFEKIMLYVVFGKGGYDMDKKQGLEK